MNITEEELQSLRDKYAGSGISYEEAIALSDKFEKETEKIFLDFESVFMSYGILENMPIERREESLKIIRGSYPTFKKKYNISFEEAVTPAPAATATAAPAASTTTSSSASDEKADSGFVATMKKMWAKFVEFLKGIWNKLRALIFGKDEDIAKNAAATAQANAENAAKNTEALVSSGVDYVELKTDICGHIDAKANSKDLLDALNKLDKGMEGAVKVTEAYIAAANKAKELFDPNKGKGTPEILAMHDKLMADIKAVYSDKPSSSIVIEAIKAKLGVDVSVYDSNAWAFADLGIKGICLLFWVEGVGKGLIPSVKNLSPSFEGDCFLNVSVSDNEAITKKISEILNKWIKSSEEINKNLATISKESEKICDVFTRTNTNSAKELKEVEKEAMAFLRKFPPAAMSLLTGFNSVVKDLSDFSNLYDKEVKEAIKKAVKDTAKENKEQAQGEAKEGDKKEETKEDKKS